MRLVFKELKKLFNLRLSIILAMFTALYFCLILSASFLYLSTGQHAYLQPLYKELLSEFGGELSLDEWDAFLDKREEVAAEFADRLAEAGSEMLKKNGVISYEDYIRKRDALLSKMRLSEEDAELMREMSRVINNNESTNKLVFRLDLMDYDYIDAKEKWHRFLSSESEYDAMVEATFGYDLYMSEAYLAQLREYATRDRVSLIPVFIAQLPYDDFGHLLALAAIICFILVLPRLINERLRSMRPVQLVTKTGRGIFAVQARACVLLGIAVGVFLSLSYCIMLCVQGMFIYFPLSMNGAWGPNADISFGSNLLIHAGLLTFFAICCSLAAYFIGRLARSYIAGIGLALPAAAALVYGFTKLTSYLLSAYTLTSLSESLTKFGGMLAIFALVLAAVVIMLKRDKVRDIL